MDILIFIVAVLTALVTVLIGWQILETISLKKRVRNILMKEVKKIEEIVDKKIALSTGAALYNLSEAMCESNLLNHAFTGYIKALCELYKDNPNSVEVNLCFEKLIKIINENRTKVLQLPDYALKGYVDMLSNVKDERKLIILSFLLKGRVE